MMKNKQPDPQKVAFLRSLPEELKSSITGDEVEQFIFGDYIPESLFEKIKHLLVEDSDEARS